MTNDELVGDAEACPLDFSSEFNGDMSLCISVLLVIVNYFIQTFSSFSSG